MTKSPWRQRRATIKIIAFSGSQPHPPSSDNNISRVSIADDLLAHQTSPTSEGGDGNTSLGPMAEEKHGEKKIFPPHRIQ